MKKFVSICLISVISIALTSCGLGHDYNLSINPPAQDEKSSDIFPTEINGDKVKVNKLEYGGVECMYGTDKSITVARLSSEDEAIAYFKQNILPSYKKQNTNFSGTVNGQFYAKAGGDWKMFGWVNNNFAFSIKATNPEKLSEIVNSFRYIENK